MEITTLSSFIEYYQRIKGRTDKLVRLVPPSHLEFRYRPGKFSPGDLIRHIAATERFMYAEVVVGRPSVYHGCHRELADGYDHLLGYYNQLRGEAMDIFRQLSAEDLQKKCLTPAGISMTAWKWLRAMIEHEIHHRGQLYTCLGMLGIATPPIFGMTAPEVEARSRHLH